MARHRSSNKASCANPALAQGQRMLAFGNAAGTHQDRRTRRVRTRSAAKRAAIRYSS